MVVFVGYSLQEADYELRCMLVRAVANSRARLVPRIAVVVKPHSRNQSDLDASEEAAVKERFQLLFGARMSFYR